MTNLPILKGISSWREEDIQNLLLEGRTIQQHLPKDRLEKNSVDHLAHSFAKLMFEGKCGVAIRMLSGEKTHGVLRSDDTVSTVDSELKEPERSYLIKIQWVSLQAKMPWLLQVIFHQRYTRWCLVVYIDADIIQSTANKHTQGVVGPSGIDGDGWSLRYKYMSLPELHPPLMLNDHVHILDQSANIWVLKSTPECRLVLVTTCHTLPQYALKHVHWVLGLL